MNRNLIYFGAFIITIFGFASTADGAYKNSVPYNPVPPKEEDRRPIEGLQAVLEKRDSLEEN